ncbi:MAG: hypothetical protein MUE51_14890 [Thermoleophilia bacterium]|jgi:hypothetical protein|nr:hypothetical protein [Thermoleophilia bacterium]
MSALTFRRLPSRHYGHPPDCVCAGHESGVWCGWDPRTGELVAPGSLRSHFLRAQVEEAYGVRFARALGRHDWDRAVAVHRGHAAAGAARGTRGRRRR